LAGKGKLSFKISLAFGPGFKSFISGANYRCFCFNISTHCCFLRSFLVIRGSYSL